MLAFTNKRSCGFILKQLSNVKNPQKSKKAVFLWLVTEGKSASTCAVESMGQGKEERDSEKNCWSKAPSKCLLARWVKIRDNSATE